MPPEQQTMSQNEIPVSSMPLAQAPQVGYAGFWLRFLAFTFDTFILTVVVGIPIRIIVFVAGESNNFLFLVGATVIQSLLIITYFVYLTNKNQGTIGKKLLGLKVVSESGEQLSLGKIIIRETIGRFLSVLVLGIGYLMVAFTSKKQGLHDKIAGSVVLSNPVDRKTWAFVSKYYSRYYVFTFVRSCNPWHSRINRPCFT